MKHKDMGKAWKKIAAVVLTAAMVFGTAGSVFATATASPTPYPNVTPIPDPVIESEDDNYLTTDEDVFTVTIVKNETDTATDHEYAAYQIFTGDLLITTDDKGTETTDDDERVRTLSNINWGDGINQNALGTLAGKLNTILGLTGDAQLKATSTAREFAEAIAGVEYEHDDAKSQAIAAAIGDALSNISRGTGTNTEVSGLPVGYYLIKDRKNPQDENAAQTRYILQVLADMTVYEKASVPSVVKKIKDMNDSVDPANYETFDYDNDEETAEVEWVDSADYDIGDMVPFQITATTSSMVHDFVNYHVTIQDMFSKGLDVPEEFTLKVLGLTFTIDASGDTWAISPNATQATSSGKTVVTVAKAAVEDEDSFNDSGVKNGSQFAIKVSFATSQAASEGSKIDSEADSKDIVIEYESKLNENAVIGNKGNPNEVYLNYSNNPNSADDLDEGKTPNDEVVAFTYDIDVLKYDDKNPKNPLAGAEFKLFKVPADTDLHALFDGNLTNNTAMTNDVVETLVDELTGLAETCVGSTKNENKGVYTTTASGDDHNLFTFTGIDAGTYVLLETKTPNGYNTCLPYIFDVVATHSAAAEPTDIINGNVLTAIEGVGNPQADTSSFATLDVTNVITFNNPHTQPEDATDKTNLGQGGLETDVINKAGAILPSTGGIGTTLFYVIGAILVIGAGIVLVTRRRMAQ